MDTKNDFKTKKRVLDRYKTYMSRLRRLKSKLESVIDSLGAKSVRYSDMPKGHGGFDASDLMIEKIDLEKRIEELEIQTKELKIKILSAIEKLENDNYSAAIEMYYIDFMTINDIAMELNCGFSTVKRYIKRAINDMNISELN